MIVTTVIFRFDKCMIFLYNATVHSTQYLPVIILKWFISYWRTIQTGLYWICCVCWWINMNELNGWDLSLCKEYEKSTMHMCKTFKSNWKWLAEQICVKLMKRSKGCYRIWNCLMTAVLWEIDFRLSYICRFLTWLSDIFHFPPYSDIFEYSNNLQTVYIMTFCLVYCNT